MRLGKSLEDYLETILILKNKSGNVRSIDVARHMGFSKPSVSHAVKELQKIGCIVMDTDGTLNLTKDGKEYAEQVYERHCFFKDLLIDAGVDPVVAEDDACNMEHVISDESFEKLKKKL